MDKRASEHDATRREILAAVIDVAAEAGLDALTVQAVAARADVALRTVYNHFDTRDALIAAALGELAESTRASVREIAVAGDSARDELLAFVDAYLRSYESQGAATRVLMGAATVPAVADAVSDVRAWRREQLRSTLRRANADGALRIALADAVTIAYLATAYSTYASLTRDAGLSPAAARSLVRTMLEGALFGS